MNLQEKIEALEKEFNEKIEILKSEAQQAQEFFPEIGEYYFYINDAGDIYRTEYAPPYNDDDYECRKGIGNIFKNRDEACFTVEKLKVEAELRKFSRPFEEDESNYFIQIRPSHNNVTLDSDECYQTQGTIYFESAEKARQAIEAVGGRDRIKKYIFGMED